MTLSEGRVNHLIEVNLPMPSHIRHIVGGVLTGRVNFTSKYTHGESWAAIETIGSGLLFIGSVNINLLALTRVDGDIYFGENSQVSLTALTSIKGHLILHRNAKVDLPALTSIGNYLHLRENSQANLNALASIGGDFYAYENVAANLAALTSIGGSLSIDYYTEPLPTQIRHMETRDNFKLIYQAEAIANQVAASSEVSVIKRRTGV